MVSLKAIEVLSHNHLNRVYSRLVLSKMGFQEGFEALTIIRRKGYWSGDIKVVEKVCYMEENRVTSLIQQAISSMISFYNGVAYLGDSK